MIKQSVTYGDWKVDRHDNHKIEVYKKGVLCAKSSPALRDIAKEIGLQVNPDWRTSQLGRNVQKAMEAASKGETYQNSEEGMLLIEKLRDSFIVETEDQVYYDAETAEEDMKDLFISNIEAQMIKSEIKIFETLKYTDAASFINYLEEQPDMNLAQIIVVAAYCAFYCIEIDEDTREVADEQLYYFNDCQDLHYEYETDIDLG